jgi:Holliday junction resolvasome RuvABC ATP-dependent DNA helicase subunit
MFETLIGQSAVKNKLGFYAKAQHKTSVSPFLLLVAEKGSGKTHFARNYGKGLLRSDGKGEKKFLEINSSTIVSTKQFLETLYIPSVMGEEVSILFDEAHELPKNFVAALLTIMDVSKGTRKTLRTGEGEFDFNFKELAFIFATTEPDQLFDPLVSRMERIDFAQYTHEELGEILTLNVPDVKIDDKIMSDITATLRGNARQAVKMAQNIDKWAEINSSTKFGKKEWKDLRDQLGIMPYGLTDTEVQVLDLLHKRGPLSLQMISATTGFSRRAIQRNVENYLLACGFMDIDGQRKITEAGVRALEAVRKEI